MASLHRFWLTEIKLLLLLFFWFVFVITEPNQASSVWAAVNNISATCCTKRGAVDPGQALFKSSRRNKMDVAAPIRSNKNPRGILSWGLMVGCFAHSCRSPTMSRENRARWVPASTWQRERREMRTGALQIFWTRGLINEEEEEEENDNPTLKMESNIRAAE